MFKRITLSDNQEWLKAREKGIGGSDASCIVGLNQYKSNVQLWKEKTGKTTPEDISNKPYVVYGTKAESPIRQLFELDYPNYKVLHEDNLLLQNVEYPFLQASLDGELTDENGRKGILEIKTSNILQSTQFEKWNNKIPDNYYIQVLHYLLVTDYEFVVLRVHLISRWNKDVRTTVKHYSIERNEVMEDLEYLLNQEIEFWKKVQNDTKPNLILPQI